MSSLLLYDYCLKRDSFCGEKGTVTKIVTTILSLIEGYNKTAKKLFENKGLVLPELTLNYRFENEFTVVLRLTCTLDDSQTQLLEQKNSLETSKHNFEQEVYKQRTRIKELESLLERKEKELKDKDEEIKREWQKIQSVTYRPEVKTLTEEELREQVYKEYMNTYLPDYEPKEE